MFYEHWKRRVRGDVMERRITIGRLHYHSAYCHRVITTGNCPLCSDYFDSSGDCQECGGTYEKSYDTVARPSGLPVEVVECQSCGHELVRGRKS